VHDGIGALPDGIELPMAFRFPKTKMLRANDTFAARSATYKGLEMEKYGSELLLTDGKQDDARKARRKSDVLVNN